VTTEPSPATKVDGRRASRARNLLAVVDAMLELFAEGNLDPGAQEIAERSGVSRRSVFRYFDDMESLGRVAIKVVHDRLAPFMVPPAPVTAPLNERVHALAQQRASLFERAAPAARVLRVRAPFRPLMREELERNRRILDSLVATYFADELDRFDASARQEVLDALCALYSFEMFEFLSAHGPVPAHPQAVVERAVSALLLPVAK
jgi:AcrR family transcriptional regulator